METYDVFHLFIVSLIFLIAIFGLYNYNQLSAFGTSLFFFTAFLFISEAISFYFAIRMKSNTVFFHIVPYFHHLFITATYFSLFKGNPKLRRFTVYSILLFFAFSLVNTVFFQDLNQVPTLSIILQSFLIIVYTSIHFYVIISDYKGQTLSKNNEFWFSTGNLFYYPCLMLLWLLIVYQKDYEQALPGFIFFLLILANIFLYIFYFFALFTDVKVNNTKDS